MTDIPLQFSIIDSNATIMKKRKQLPPSPPNNNHRNLPMSSNATLPIITLPSFSNFEQKIIQMATKNKPTIRSTHTPTDFRMAQTKPHTRTIHRSNTSMMTKFPHNYPPTIKRPTTSHNSNNQQQNTRSLYIVNTPMLSDRSISARIPNIKPNPVLPRQQQQQLVLPHPHPEYGHFLAYLRRQSLARTRRKQQEEEGNTNHVETTIRLSLNKHPSTQLFQSTSHQSLESLPNDISPIPMISMTAKRAGRPLSFRHSITTYRLNTLRQSPLPILKNSIDNQFLTLTSPSDELITPRNSVVDDASMTKPPYDIYLNDDMLNYCYVSDDSGIKYQGRMLPTAV